MDLPGALVTKFHPILPSPSPSRCLSLLYFLSFFQLSSFFLVVLILLRCPLPLQCFHFQVYLTSLPFHSQQLFSDLTSYYSIPTLSFTAVFVCTGIVNPLSPFPHPTRFPVSFFTSTLWDFSTCLMVFSHSFSFLVRFDIYVCIF